MENLAIVMTHGNPLLGPYSKEGVRCVYWEIGLGEAIWLIQTKLGAHWSIPLKESTCHSLYLYFLLCSMTCFECGGC